MSPKVDNRQFQCVCCPRTRRDLDLTEWVVGPDRKKGVPAVAFYACNEGPCVPVASMQFDFLHQLRDRVEVK